MQFATGWAPPDGPCSVGEHFRSIDGAVSRDSIFQYFMFFEIRLFSCFATSFLLLMFAVSPADNTQIGEAVCGAVCAVDGFLDQQRDLRAVEAQSAFTLILVQERSKLGVVE
jgi:hypothetical protein